MSKQDELNEEKRIPADEAVKTDIESMIAAIGGKKDDDDTDDKDKDKDKDKGKNKDKGKKDDDIEDDDIEDDDDSDDEEDDIEDDEDDSDDDENDDDEDVKYDDNDDDEDDDEEDSDDDDEEDDEEEEDDDENDDLDLKTRLAIAEAKLKGQITDDNDDTKKVVKLEPIDFVGEDDVEELLNNKEAINALLNKVRVLTYQEALKSLPTVTSNLVKRQSDLERTVTTFYAANKDLEKFKDFMSLTAQKVQNEFPGIDTETILKLTAKRVRKSLDLKKPKDSKKKSSGKKKKKIKREDTGKATLGKKGAGGGGGKRNTKKKDPTSQKNQIDAMFNRKH